MLLDEDLKPSQIISAFTWELSDTAPTTPGFLGALAGSATNLMECLKTVVQKMGIPLETAVACATRNPARCLVQPSMITCIPRLAWQSSQT